MQSGLRLGDLNGLPGMPSAVPSPVCAVQELPSSAIPSNSSAHISVNPMSAGQHQPHHEVHVKGCCLCAHNHTTWTTVNDALR